MLPSRPLPQAALVIGVALVAALAMVWWRPPDPAEVLAPLNDSADFDHLARMILEGRGFVAPTGEPTAFRPPVYPVFLAAIYAVAGVSNFMAVAVVQAVLAAAQAGMLWAAARRVGLGDRVALLAGLVAGVYPAFVFQVPQVLGEVLHRALLAALLLLLIEAWHRGEAWRWWLASGLLLGVAVLSKPPLLLAVPALALWALWLRRREGLRGALLAALLLGAGASAVVGSWTVRNAVASRGAFIPISTNFPITFAFGVTRHSVHAVTRSDPADLMEAPDELLELTQLRTYRGLEEERAVGAEWLARARAHIAQRPGWFAQLTVRKGLQFWSPLIRNRPSVRLVALATMTPVLVGGWLFVACAFTRRGARWRPLVLMFLALSVPPMVPHAFSQPDVRYRLALAEPLWIVMAAGLLALRRPESSDDEGR